MTVIEAKTYSAATPTKMSLFLRSFLPWQFIRFIIINIRMMIMIHKSHGTRLELKNERK